MVTIEHTLQTLHPYTLISGFSKESYESALSTATPLLAIMGAVSLAIEIVTAVVW